MNSNYDLRAYTSNPRYRKHDYSQNRSSLQDKFFAEAIKNEITLDIYLKNEGLKRGKLRAYDNWCVLLTDGDQQYLIFKSSIMSIRPDTKLDLGYKLSRFKDQDNYAYIAENASKYNS